MRQREVTESSASDRGTASQYRTIQRAAQIGHEIGLPFTADVAEEALQDAKVRIAGGVDRHLTALETDSATHVEPRAVSHQAHRRDTRVLSLECQSDGPVVLDD